MNKRTLLLGALTSLGSALLTGNLQGQSQQDVTTLILDVAMDARTLNFTRSDAPATGPLRGDSFLVNGRIFDGGSIPNGNTTNVFEPDAEGSTGYLVSRGIYITNGSDIAAGANHHSATTQVFVMDSGDGLVTEGLEGSVPELRAVIGGTGAYSGAIGEVTQEVVGTNGTGGYNLRFTFTIHKMTPSDPAATARVKAAVLKARSKR
jgi:hypothetical protein